MNMIFKCDENMKRIMYILNYIFIFPCIGNDNNRPHFHFRLQVFHVRLKDMTTVVLLYSLQLCCMSRVSGVQNKYQISNHSCGTKQQAQIQVLYVTWAFLQWIVTNCTSYQNCLCIFNLQYGFFLCLSPWKQFFNL